MTTAPRILIGDALDHLPTLEPDSVHLTFTSPPYFNARDYDGSEPWPSYAAYLTSLALTFDAVQQVTAPGRYLVVNTSPVLVPRPIDGSSSQSTRHAIPFDLHARLVAQGWEFVEDIVWVKPAAASRGSARGWRRHGWQPLTWKPELVTEYILAYRKPGRLTKDVLADYDDKARLASVMPGDFEPTNVWEIAPRQHPTHPAVFPRELAERVIRAYSFVGDVVLDPFAGTGTTLWAAEELGRRSIGIERNAEYLPAFESVASKWREGSEPTGPAEGAAP